jgi:hypothetical protein
MTMIGLRGVTVPFTIKLPIVDRPALNQTLEGVLMIRRQAGVRLGIVAALVFGLPTTLSGCSSTDPAKITMVGGIALPPETPDALASKRSLAGPDVLKIEYTSISEPSQVKSFYLVKLEKSGWTIELGGPGLTSP